MAYKVVIAPIARQDIDDYSSYIAQDSLQHAERWKVKVISLCLSLRDMPRRFPVVPELENPAVRSVNVHSHRVIYEVDEELSVVNILRIWPAASDIKADHLKDDT